MDMMERSDRNFNHSLSGCTSKEHMPLSLTLVLSAFDVDNLH